MIKKSFLLGAIASVIAINSVFADTIVTSQSYVDNHDALKQDKITAGTTGNVVTYNGTQNGQAQFSERGIFNPETDFDFQNNTIAPGHEGDLVTARIFPDVGQMYNQIQVIQNNMPDFDDLPETTVTYKTCYQEVNGDCILWNLSDRDVYGHECRNHSDCDWMDAQCDSGMAGMCNTDTGKCRCGAR